MTHYIAYYRVSTDKQGRSGLGLEAQREAVKRILDNEDRIMGDHVEVESGTINRRPQLQAALAKCRETGATLVIGKLDRLSRNVAFIAGLMDSGVKFLAADMPNAGEFELHIRAALAQEERRLISERTRHALKAAKDRGVVLGGHRGRKLTRAEQTRGTQASTAARQRKAAQHAASVGPLISELREAGVTSLAGIARALNDRCVATPRGGAWQASQVRRVLDATAP